MTNFDRIKNMNVSELANFLMSIYTQEQDDWGDFDFITYIDGIGFRWEETCADWLESETE